MKTRRSNYRLKYYDSWFLGIKKYISGVIYPWDDFLGAVFLRVICPRGNYVWGNYSKLSEMQFSSGAISRGLLSGGNYLWSNFPGVITPRQPSRGQLFGGKYSSGAITLGDNCPGGYYPGGNFPRGQLSGDLL